MRSVTVISRHFIATKLCISKEPGSVGHVTYMSKRKTVGLIHRRPKFLVGDAYRFNVFVTVHRVKFLEIKPTSCPNSSNLFWERNCTCFGQFVCPSSGVFHCTHSSGICHTGLPTAWEQDQDGTSWSCSHAVNKTVWHIPLLYVLWKTPDNGQRNCPKYVDFHSKNKFEK